MFSGRLNYIHDINKFVSESKSVLNDILGVFEWQTPSVDCNVKKDEKSVFCPNDSHHIMPEKYLEKHVALCSLRKNGYCSEDVFFPPANEEGRNMVVIGDDVLEGILKNASPCRESVMPGDSVKKRCVPQTSDRLFTDFTRAERCAIYDYAIKNTSHSSESNLDDLNIQVNKTQDASKPKSLEELLAAERDAKRRRIRYRSKKVHTGRKTQTEIVREVIQSQMEGYEEWLQHQGYKIPEKQTDNLSAHIDKPNNDENSITSDNRCSFKEIVRDWDDWHYYYKGNPHKRYLTILEEERDLESRKKEKKLSRNDTTSESSRRKYVRDDDRCNKDEGSYAKIRKKSKEREREKSTEKGDYYGYSRRHDDKYHQKDIRSYRDFENFKARNNEENCRYRSYDRKRSDRNRSYEREYSESSRRKPDSRDRSMHRYKEEKYHDGYNQYMESHSSLTRHYEDSDQKHNSHDKKHKSKKRKHKSKHRKHKKKMPRSRSSESDSDSSKTDSHSSKLS